MGDCPCPCLPINAPPPPTPHPTHHPPTQDSVHGVSSPQTGNRKCRHEEDRMDQGGSRQVHDSPKNLGKFLLLLEIFLKPWGISWNFFTSLNLGEFPAFSENFPKNLRNFKAFLEFSKKLGEISCLPWRFSLAGDKLLTFQLYKHSLNLTIYQI